ncbi:timeless-like protein [Alligator mississippiensis]|uniref:Timeless-like protein n=1 Tax=Alligator mississippiensis TaxID=8496 RepID=A0A151MHV6_ALLMI|nr:timeless-like protein [Alligator mississippiensis]
MTEGYGTHEPRGARHGPIWSEEEEEQLRKLYLEVKEKEDDDVIGHILSHLPGPARTRKQVVKQLVQLGLAHSARDFPPPRKGTNIVLWTEEQELELQRLFEEFQGTDDILGNILRHLTAKRSRARVVDKLLSLGLVSERKELYKKRRRKPGPVWEAPELAQSLWQDGLAGPLLWLKTCLHRTATDRQQARLAQPVPLVPLSEENEDAMEEPRFQRLLCALGLRPPASEQESFWRIPAALSPPQLRQAAASIAQGDTRGLEAAEEEEEAVGGMEQRAQAMDALQLAQSKRLAPGAASSSLEQSPRSDSEREDPGPSQPRPKRRRWLDSEEEDDPDSPAAEPAWGDPREQELAPGRRKRLHIEDED